MTGYFARRPEPLSPEQISKLPKWAREHVRRVEQALETLTEELEQVKGTRPGAIAVRDPYGEQVPLAWDMYDEVRFATSGEWDEDTRDWIAVRRRHEGRIEVTGSGTLQMTSQASNVFHVSNEPR